MKPLSENSTIRLGLGITLAAFIVGGVVYYFRDQTSYASDIRAIQTWIQGREEWSKGHVADDKEKFQEIKDSLDKLNEKVDKQSNAISRIQALLERQVSQAAGEIVTTMLLTN